MSAAVLEHGTVARLTEKFGWLADFQGDLKVWQGWYRVAARTEELPPYYYSLDLLIPCWA